MCLFGLQSPPRLQYNSSFILNSVILHSSNTVGFYEFKTKIQTLLHSLYFIPWNCSLFERESFSRKVRPCASYHHLTPVYWHDLVTLAKTALQSLCFHNTTNSVGETGLDQHKFSTFQTPLMYFSGLLQYVYTNLVPIFFLFPQWVKIINHMQKEYYQSWFWWISFTPWNTSYKF